MLVLEDSPAGLTAAKAAGAFAVGVPHEHSPAEGLGHADLIVARLDDPALLVAWSDRRPSEPETPTKGDRRCPLPVTWKLRSWIVPRASAGSGLLPYVLPMAMFTDLSRLEAWKGGRPAPEWYPRPRGEGGDRRVPGCRCRSTWRDLRPRAGARGVGPGGRVGAGRRRPRVGLDGLYPSLPFLESRRRRRSTRTSCPRRAAAFLVVRFFGLVLLVPVFEELFSHSFRIR